MREIALHMADIAENSLAAGAARIKLSVMIDRAADRLTTTLEDNGCGMDADTLYRCTDPFMTTRTARRVGLGIALFKLSAEQSGGSFTIRSEQGRGTRAEAAYIISGIDRAPLGSIADTMAALRLRRIPKRTLLWNTRRTAKPLPSQRTRYHIMTERPLLRRQLKRKYNNALMK